MIFLVHLPQRLQEGRLGVVAFQTGHHGAGHLAKGELIAMQLVAAY